MKDWDMNLRQKFIEKLNELSVNGISQNSIAKELGIDKSYITKYKNQDESIDVPEIEQKIRAWLETREERQQVLQIGYVDILATSAIFRAINNCKRDRDFSVIVGSAGSSKTWTVKKYIEMNTGIYIKINQSTRGALLRTIAKALGVSMSGSTITLYEKVIGSLAGRDTVIIVDEADYLHENCKELLRHISDDAQVGICLIGLPRLEMQLVSEAKEDYQQLLRRVGTFLNLNIDVPYTTADCEKILKSVWVDISPELVTQFYRASKGSIGTLTKLMVKSHEMTVESGRRLPAAADLEIAKKTNMRSCNTLVRA